MKQMWVQPELWARPCLRVAREFCELRDGRLWFENAPVTGAVAETQPAGPLLGKVTLHEYRDGLLVGPWADEVIDLAGADLWNETRSDNDAPTDFWFNSVERFGWLIRWFEDGRVGTLDHSDRAATSYVSFSPDGSIRRWQGQLPLDVTPYSARVLWIWENRTLRAATIEFVPPTDGPLIVGSALFDTEGRLSRAEFGDAYFDLVDQFDVRGQLEQRPPIAWLPTDPVELATYEWASEFDTRVRGLSSAFTHLVINHNESLAHVHHLHLAVGGINLSTMQQLLDAMPNLRILDVSGSLRANAMGGSGSEDDHLFDALVAIWRRRTRLRVTFRSIELATISEQRTLLLDTTSVPEPSTSVAVFDDTMTHLIGFESAGGDPSVFIHAATNSPTFEFGLIGTDRYNIDAIRTAHPHAEVHVRAHRTRARTSEFIDWITRHRTK